jgi:hypothetical protein
MPHHLLKIIDPVIQRNAYWGHPENLLLSMLRDSRPHIRYKAVTHIIEAREDNDVFRQFVVPNIDLNAPSYEKMIQWDRDAITEPPLTKHLTTADLKHALLTGEELAFAELPNHTQSVERTVKLVTETAAKYFGHDRRHGAIATTMKARDAMKDFNSKQDFSTI